MRREKQKACNEHGSSVNLDPRQVWCLDLRSVPPREGHRLPPSPLHIFKLSPWSGRSGGASSEDVCEGRGCRCYAHRGVLWGRTPPSSGGCPVSPPPWQPPVSPLGALRVRCLAATGVTFRCTVCAMPLRPLLLVPSPSAASGGPLGQPYGPGAPPSAASSIPVGPLPGATLHPLAIATIWPKSWTLQLRFLL